MRKRKWRQNSICLELVKWGCKRTTHLEEGCGSPKANISRLHHFLIWLNNWEVVCNCSNLNHSEKTRILNLDIREQIIKDNSSANPCIQERFRKRKHWEIQPQSLLIVILDNINITHTVLELWKTPINSLSVRSNAENQFAEPPPVPERPPLL
jgi:hypothetical protein